VVEATTCLDHRSGFGCTTSEFFPLGLSLVYLLATTCYGARPGSVAHESLNVWHICARIDSHRPIFKRLRIFTLASHRSFDQPSCLHCSMSDFFPLGFVIYCFNHRCWLGYTISKIFFPTGFITCVYLSSTFHHTFWSPQKFAVSATICSCNIWQQTNWYMTQIRSFVSHTPCLLSLHPHSSALAQVLLSINITMW